MSEENNENKEVIEVQGQVENQENVQLNKEGQEGENIMALATTDQEGIQISNDVIAVIAGVAVSEVSGVASMAGGFAGGISEVLSGKKNMAKGIKVDKTESKVKIDVNIVVEYGTRIPDVAFEIQNRVKKAVENMTGMSVVEVNVHVQGVDINSVKKENETAKTQDNN